MTAQDGPATERQPLASRARPAPPLPDRLPVLIERRVFGEGPRHIAVPRKKILYGFSPYAIDHSVIDAPWAKPSMRFKGRKIFFRTARTVVKSDCDSIPKAIERLSDLVLIRAYHGLFVNLRKIARVDFDGKLKRIGFEVRDAQNRKIIEWVRVSNEVARFILRMR